MLKSIRRTLCAAAVLSTLGLITPTVTRADVDMSDSNTYWQVANSPTPPDPGLDYNTYWAEVQAQQQNGPNR
jgi:hypothetical protein